MQDPRPSSLPRLVPRGATAVYAHALDTLTAAGLPYLVGGGHALAHYTRIKRATRDLDLFLRPGHVGPAMDALAAAGYATERTHPHWLGKARAGRHCVDLIFNSGNGLSEVDDVWFEKSRQAEILGRTIRTVPPEELTWTKLFIMERERYDGADVAHLLYAASADFDWRRLRDRVGPHWRVLLSHLILFGFIYPSEQARIPAWLLDELTGLLQRERQEPAPHERVCHGTLLSRQQYLHDVRAAHYRDVRATAASTMSARDIAAWTTAGERDSRGHDGDA
jgi:hypothetical protein